MSDDITFGDVEHAEPELEIRPDRNAQFVTAEIGECRPGELEIFVDLDVMRDMEAHALSNTRVELGGVMLGKQLLDKDGVPYVVVTDSLRAEHYEATKGSFKFTHDTWSQITRQRESFHPDLEMVGWYHTHPGWSVFLSGMDLFICNNFFNRPLDVALVIDPCEQDRGWFQWTGKDPARTQRTGGFKLITGRYRKNELDYFARIYNKEPDMNYDPRYGATSSGSTSVQLTDGRKSTMEIAVIGMLALQFLLLLVFGWRMLGPPQTPSEKVAELQEKIDKLENERAHSELEQIYKDEFNRLAMKKSGSANYGQELISLRRNQRLLEANLDGQLAKNRELLADKSRVVKQSKELKSKLDSTTGTLKRTQAKVKEKAAEIAQYEKAGAKKSDGRENWILGGVALLSLGVGLGAGFLFTPRNGDSPTPLAEFSPEKTSQLTTPNAAQLDPVKTQTQDPSQPIEMKKTNPDDANVVKFQD